ncbi:MAG: hypothetical protein KDB00_10930 [Planctomycetales bacterium]|nr:hypothetical protein [Planctomycetales bacterium]
MSTTKLIEFENGVPANHHEFHNSWAGAARIWGSLYDHYLKDSSKPFDNWLTSTARPGDRRLWDLAKSDALSMAERAVHAFTFDYFIVRRENLERFSADLRTFAELHPAPGKVDHLPEWADVFEHSAYEAIALHATSVTENPWYGFDEETDEPIPYDLNERNLHTEVYQWLSEIDGPPSDPDENTEAPMK